MSKRSAKKRKKLVLPMEGDEASTEPVAVIDVGTTSIRMTIAQINKKGVIHPLESLHQVVELGKNTFTRGSIDRETTEECVKALKSFRRVLDEYGISKRERIRAVATSAVREASNCQAFLDRLFVATGIDVEAIDEAEVNRLTYLAVYPMLKESGLKAHETALIVEVGGGSTEVLEVYKNNVVHSESYRLGSLRIRKIFEAHHAAPSTFRSIVEGQISAVIQVIKQNLRHPEKMQIVGMGGDMQLALHAMKKDQAEKPLSHITTKKLKAFTDEVLSMSVDDLVVKYHVSYADAETLGPTLLAYVLLADACALPQIYIAQASLRMGLVKELASRDSWAQEFKDQIVRSALELGRQYDFDESHAQHVALLSMQIFDALQSEHELDPRYRLILHIAALLHEVGRFINNRSLHKHSMYLIQHSELFGLGGRDQNLVALVARYHRRASPKPSHIDYMKLDRSGRIAVSKLGAILRVADALDRSRSQRVGQLTCKQEGRTLTIGIPKVSDLTLEQLALQQKGRLFEDVYGLEVQLRRKRK